MLPIHQYGRDWTQISLFKYIILLHMRAGSFGLEVKIAYDEWGFQIVEFSR
jgi:hypothetical protein